MEMPSVKYFLVTKQRDVTCGKHTRLHYYNETSLHVHYCETAINFYKILFIFTPKVLTDNIKRNDV